MRCFMLVYINQSQSVIWMFQETKIAKKNNMSSIIVSSEKALLTLSFAVAKYEIDMSTETFMGRASSWTTAFPTSSIRLAIAPTANFPVLSYEIK